MATHLDKQIEPLTIEVIEVLQAYDWPGNVRELEHTINRAVIVCQDSQIEVADIGLINSSPPVSSDREIVPMAEFERLYILKVLKATNWKIRGTERSGDAPAITAFYPVWQNKKTGYQASLITVRIWIIVHIRMFICNYLLINNIRASLNFFCTVYGSKDIKFGLVFLLV